MPTVAIALLIALVEASPITRAQDPTIQLRNTRPSPQPGTLTAVRAVIAPKLDGVDDDAVWLIAHRREDFRTFTPSEDADPTFRTELRAAYDDAALYIFVRAFDPRPDSIVQRLSRRDTDGAPNDQIQLFIDSFFDRRSGYEYIVSAGGVKSDYLLFDDTGFDQSWNGVWDVATRVDSLGWTAEFAIPLQQLRYTDRESPIFGLMVWRLIGRTGERVSWPLYRPSRSGYVSQTGTLDGLRGLVGHARIEAAPYVLARGRNAATGAAPRPGVQTSLALGGDLRFLPRPNVSIDVTINPDFGQVESDPAVLDLSGFEVFRTERRPFFLEGAGQFHFPLASDGSALLFHSRRIGRSPALGPVYGAGAGPAETSIHGAAKLTGRLSPATSFVALSALTAEERGRTQVLGERPVVEPTAHYAVARVQRDFRRGRSGLALMVTRVDRSRGDSTAASILPRSAQAAAVATQHQTRDGNYRVSGWLAASDVRGTASAISRVQRSNVHGFQQSDDGVAFDSARTSLSGTAGYLFAGKVAGGITRYDASYRWIAPEFDVNEAGFLTTAGVQRLTANAGLRATRAGRLAGVPYNNAAVTLGAAAEWSTGGLAFAREVSLTGTMQFINLAQIQTTIAQQLPGAYCTMTCTRGGPALVDPPRTRLAVAVTGDPRRQFVPSVSVDWARDDEGRSHVASGRADVLWHARSNVDVSVALDASEATHDAFFYGSVEATSDSRVTVARLAQPARSVTGRVDFTVTTALSVQWYAQAYVSRGTYSMLREVVKPRADEYEARFRAVGDSGARSAFAGTDFRQLRSNAVLRWEYRPGSTLFFVWTQGRDIASTEPGGLRLGSDLRALFRQRPMNQVAVKLSYWLSA
ncbi:MAG TPA: DUF5916 domain-containing protein [Gemmatimonadaceae bacterium]|jgi:hypothetical protein|nr:DUF5916 domain-containing protein [Gemmatimonadaceae bacterium]